MADLWESPFFLVAFHGNFKSGTAQSGSLVDVVQTTQVAIPTSGRQKITYVLSNQDKLFVFDHSDPVDHSEVVFFTLSYDAGVAQRIHEDFWCDIKLTRWGAASIPTAQNEYHARDLERAWIQLGRRPLLPVRNDVKLDTPHHRTSWTHGDEEKDHNDQPKDEL